MTLPEGTRHDGFDGRAEPVVRLLVSQPVVGLYGAHERRDAQEKPSYKDT